MSRPVPRRVASASLLAVAALLVGSGCAKLLGAAEEEVEGRVATPGGTSGPLPDPCGASGPSEEEPAAEGPPPPVVVTSVTPSRGPTTGGTNLEIVGFGFLRENIVPVVQFGPSPFDRADPSTVIVDSDTLMHCVTPPHTLPEAVAVRVFVGEDMGILESAFTYFDPLRIDVMSPSEGLTDGFTLLSFQGAGFLPGTLVTVGAASPIAATIQDGNNMTLRVPELPRGIHLVTVSNLNGTLNEYSTSATLPGTPVQFTAYERVRITGVAPFAGPLGGGTELDVLGQGFVGGTTLTVGEQETPATASLGENRLDMTTLAASPASEGPVDLVATNTNGTSRLRRGFVYYDPNNTTPRIIAVTPNSGALAAGQTVRVILGGMPDSNTTLSFGGVSAACTSSDARMFECQRPACSEGPVDVRAVNGGIDLTATGAFDCVDLRIESFLPDSGAIAGGTYARLIGSGFADQAEVLVDGRNAVDVETDGPTIISFRTPRGLAGTVDVILRTQDTELTLNDAFTYFDPAATDRVSSGGPVSGAVNVTVFGDSELLADAYVQIGATIDASRPYLRGYTNDSGQITLSGPNLDGPVDVHGGKSGFSAFSVIGVDAQNIRMDLFSLPAPPPDPLPECPQGQGGGAPPLLRGSVSRVKDIFNDGSDRVVVTTSFDNIGGALPIPGNKNQMTSQGDFEIFSRTGDMIVIALAGTVEEGNILNVHGIGFHPFLFADASSGIECTVSECCPEGETCEEFSGQGYCLRVYDDIDITIDTIVDHPMRMSLDDPPHNALFTLSGSVPKQTQAQVWLDFGYQGAFPMMGYPLGPYNPMIGVVVDPVIAEDVDVLYFDVPRFLPPDLASTTVYADVAVVGEDDLGLPVMSSNVQTGFEVPRDEIIMTPMLPLLYETRPWAVDYVSPDPMGFGLQTLPATTTQPSPSHYLHYMYQVLNEPVCIGPMGVVSAPQFYIYWQALAPGHRRTFDLPRFKDAAEGANILPADLPDTDGTCDPAALAPECAKGGECDPGLANCARLVLWQMVGAYNPEQSFNSLDVGAAFSSPSQTMRVTAFVSD